MNYKALLMKYLAHINDVEGATFLADGDRNAIYYGNTATPETGSWGTVFTDEEWTEMQALDAGTKQLTLSEVKEL